MRLFPKNPWRPLGLLAIGALIIGWKLRENRLNQRLYDHAHLVVEQERTYLNAFLQAMQTEASADVRIIITPDVGRESIEDFAVRHMRELGVGRRTNGRGLLLVYDVAHRRARIEVGPHLQGEITDAFVGYLMRENMRQFFEGGNPALGLRATLIIVQHRLRRALLGEGYDTSFVAFVGDVRRLAIGGGASARVELDTISGAFINRRASAETKAYFAPQPTVVAAYERYFEWLARAVRVGRPPLRHRLAGLAAVDDDDPGLQGLLAAVGVRPKVRHHRAR